MDSPLPLAYHREALDPKYLKVLDKVPPRASVLEIGCHTGYFSKALLERGHDVTAIEKDFRAAKVARQMGVSVKEGDVEGEGVLGSLRRTFEVILLMDVIEHLARPEKVLRALHPLLAPEGRLILTVPNVAYWAVRWQLLRGRWDYQDAGILDRTHLRFFTLDSLRREITSAHFCVDEIGSADGMLPKEQWLSKLPGLTPLREKALSLFPRLFAISFLAVARSARPQAL